MSSCYNLAMIKQFLSQSNQIEGVTDSDSLKQALKAWDYIIAQDSLTPEVVLKTHGILMLNQDLAPEEKGQFRKHEVRIGSSYGALYIVVPQRMTVWCFRANEKKTAEKIKRDHVLFEKIHPFIDGNGRMGRILLNWQRIKNGLPILVIKNSEKQDYYTWFETT